jgi:hypothetical protein
VKPTICVLPTGPSASCTPTSLVSKLVAPKLATAGDVIAVDWTVKNVGSAAARGNWADKLYLSTDATLDGGDRLLTTLPHTGPLASRRQLLGAHRGDAACLIWSGRPFITSYRPPTAGGQVKEYQAEDNNQREQDDGRHDGAVRRPDDLGRQRQHRAHDRRPGAHHRHVDGDQRRD